MNDAPFYILGVDPGLSGALAFYTADEPNRITVDDMPVVDKNIDCARLARRIRQFAPSAAIIEQVASRPGEGQSRVFKFGCGYGMVQGVIAALGIPVAFVTPGKWKRHYGLSADKEQSRAAAIKLWPGSEAFERKKDAGRAEAALIAKYGAEIILKQAPAQVAA